MNLTWKKIEELSFRAGFRKLVKKKFHLPNGKIQDFDIKDEGKAVCILALTKNNEVILVKQYRPGPELILLEMPGGFLDLNEPAEYSARRELLEETGHTGDFEFIGTTLDCAYSNMIRYNFIARNCIKVKEPELDEGEFIQTTFCSLEEFLELIRSGQMTDVESGYRALDHMGFLRFSKN